MIQELNLAKSPFREDRLLKDLCEFLNRNVAASWTVPGSGDLSVRALPNVSEPLVVGIQLWRKRLLRAVHGVLWGERLAARLVSAQTAKMVVMD